MSGVTIFYKIRIMTVDNFFKKKLKNGSTVESLPPPRPTWGKILLLISVGGGSTVDLSWGDSTVDLSSNLR